MNLGEYIKNVLKERGMTQSWLADNIGMNRKVLNSKIRSGYFTALELLQIGNVLHIDLNALTRKIGTLNFEAAYQELVRNVQRLKPGDKFKVRQIMIDIDWKKYGGIDRMLLGRKFGEDVNNGTIKNVKRIGVADDGVAEYMVFTDLFIDAE